MIKIFRKFRMQLITGNSTDSTAERLSKYMLYAAGEIILVVIGILIALWINSNHNERNKQAKIDSILIQIQNDFLQDIENGDRLLANYWRKDSISDRIVGGKLTKEELDSNRKNLTYRVRSLDFVSTWRESYQIQSNGYAQLMSMLDDLPEKYEDLMKVLNHNILNRQVNFNAFSADAKDIVRQYKYYLADSHDWKAIDDNKGELSTEQIDYILNNPRFKNQVNLLHNSTVSLFWEYINYRKSLMETYLEIDKLLGENARELPEVIRTTSVAKETDAEQFIGVYNLSQGPKNTYSFSGSQLEIFGDGKELFLRSESGKEHGPLLFMDADKPWFSIVGGIDILRFQSNGENTLSIIGGHQDHTEWVKTRAE